MVWLDWHWHEFNSIINIQYSTQIFLDELKQQKMQVCGCKTTNYLGNHNCHIFHTWCTVDLKTLTSCLYHSIYIFNVNNTKNISLLQELYMVVTSFLNRIYHLISIFYTLNFWHCIQATKRLAPIVLFQLIQNNRVSDQFYLQSCFVSIL